MTITFHNPNTEGEVAKELIQIAAEVAKAKVRERLLHPQNPEDAKKQEEPL